MVLYNATNCFFYEIKLIFCIYFLWVIFSTYLNCRSRVALQHSAVLECMLCNVWSLGTDN